MAEQAPMPITGLDYGENQEANDIAAMAPLAAADEVPAFSLPSQRPYEAETEGSPFGSGTNELPLTAADGQYDDEVTSYEDTLLDTLMRTFQTSPSPELATMIRRHLNGTQ